MSKAQILQNKTPEEEEYDDGQGSKNRFLDCTYREPSAPVEILSPEFVDAEFQTLVQDQLGQSLRQSPIQ